MSRFQYFLYENFDADRESENPMNPRRFLNDRTDKLFSERKKPALHDKIRKGACKAWTSGLTIFWS